MWEQQKKLETYTPEDFTKEGFVHCSTAEQLPGTLRRFYRGRTDLVLLTLDVSATEVVYENLEGGQMLFPHIYNPLSKTMILKAEPVPPQESD